jgi:endonuclease/exonuclease/phosphatase family metal-dependent hydrolase
MNYLLKNKKKSLFRRIVKSSFLFIYFIWLSILVICLLAKVIPAQVWVVPSLLALGFPFIFIGFLIFSLITLFRKYYISLLFGLSFTLWGFFVFNHYLNFSSLFSSNTCNSKQEIKVLTFNVRLFDVYNWKINHPYHQGILDFIVKQNPDIACFQEYYYQSDNNYLTTSVLLNGLKTKYIHEYYPVINRKTDYFGIATITRFPIINKGNILFEGTSNMCIYTDILINKDTVRVYNMHLESVRLGTEDYALLSSIEQKPEDIKVSKSKSVIRHLVRALKKRNIQANIIANHIQSCHYPVIVCGDFNDIPASYTYSVISKGLTDSYSILDWKLGSTYNGNIPFLRIDYIMHSPSFCSHNYTIHRVDLSDHFPVSCSLSFAK